jgi:4-hydroxy-3-polyprenylbenzoate decarboxylase
LSIGGLPQAVFLKVFKQIHGVWSICDSTPFVSPFTRAFIIPLRCFLPDYHKRAGLPTFASALYNIAMSSHGFADFLEQLQADGGLVRQDEPVEGGLEAGAKAAEIAPRATLFTDVSDSAFPLILGIFSSPERILAAFRATSPDELANRLDEMAGCGNGNSWLERLSGGQSGPLRKYQPKTLRTGPSQQIVHLGRDVDLGGLPAPTFHADEEFPVLTAGRLITRGPDGSHLHVGRHDLRIEGSDRLVACWHPSSQPARLLAHYGRRGESMPIAIAFGGEPADLLTAMAPLPRRTDVLELSGWLRGAPCELIQGRCVDLPVPADAELVIEGTIAPNEPHADPGSGLDAMGQVRRLERGAVVRVDAVTHRPTPLFPALLPSEKSRIHQILAKAFLPFLRAELPGLYDLEFPAFGGDRRWAFVSIDKTYPGQAIQFANAFWGLSKMLPVRCLVIVDEDVDVSNADEVWGAVASHATPIPDVRITDSIPDQFQHDQSPGRMVFDATRPLP